MKLFEKFDTFDLQGSKGNIPLLMEGHLKLSL